MARITLLSLLAAACFVGAARAQESATPQQQVDEVAREGVTYAKTQLEQMYEFLPFAIIAHADGRSERILGPTGAELDPLDAPEQQQDPARALRELGQRVQREARARGDFRVVGIFSDTEIRLPDGKPSDAIQASLEHASGYCSDLFVPYGRVVNELSYGDPISAKGKGLVFSCK
jgi:hypothetical protein